MNFSCKFAKVVSYPALTIAFRLVKQTMSRVYAITAFLNPCPALRLLQDVTEKRVLVMVVVGE